MSVLLWLLADGDIRHVATPGQIGKFSPGSVRFAILDQRRFKRSAVSSLLKDPIEYAAAKLGSEEVSQSRLDSDINFETAIFCVLFSLHLQRSLGQMFRCRCGIVVDPLSNFDRRILAAALTTKQLIREVVDPREQLRVERTDIAEHF